MYVCARRRRLLPYGSAAKLVPTDSFGQGDARARAREPGGQEGSPTPTSLFLNI